MQAPYHYLEVDTILLLIFAQISIKYGLFIPFEMATILQNWQLLLLLLSSVSLLMAGQFVLAAYKNNTPQTVHNIAFRAFIICTIIGVFIGFYLANAIGRPGFTALFIVASGLCYLYASYLKEILIVRNSVIALLVFLSFLALPLFDLLPATLPENRDSQKVIFSIILDYSLLLFILMTAIEIVKDLKTIENKSNVSGSLPGVIGSKKTSIVIVVLLIIAISLVIYYLYTYLFHSVYAIIFGLLAIIAPLLYAVSLMLTSQQNLQLNRMIIILKAVLWMLSLSLLLYQFIL